jgi:hypothetical protein
VVTDVSNSPSFEDAAVLEFFELSTRNLLAAAAEAGVGHYVALSVVGAGAPVNGRKETGGPERFRMDEFFRDALAGWRDPREVVADPRARYFGTELSERSLVPGADATLGEIRYRDRPGRTPTGT